MEIEFIATAKREMTLVPVYEDITQFTENKETFQQYLLHNQY